LNTKKVDIELKAIIVGGGGQDGRHLNALLMRRGYQVTVITRDSLDITDSGSVWNLIESVQPDEVYLLAAHDHSAECPVESDAVLFGKSFAVHATATVNFLEAIALSKCGARLFFASSSHIFADAGLRLINETHVPQPKNIYAITKYSGMMACRYYREQRDVYASCGILFNHESSLRPSKYVSKKIAAAAARNARGMNCSLELGSLDAIVDWGYAPDYVDAMHRILQINNPSDFIVATGQAHTVRDFAEVAFRFAGLDYRDFVKVRPDLLTKNLETRIGDASRLKRETGWKPTFGFEELVATLVSQELSILSPAQAEN